MNRAVFGVPSQGGRRHRRPVVRVLGGGGAVVLSVAMNALYVVVADWGPVWSLGRGWLCMGRTWMQWTMSTLLLMLLTLLTFG